MSSTVARSRYTASPAEPGPKPGEHAQRYFQGQPFHRGVDVDRFRPRPYGFTDDGLHLGEVALQRFRLEERRHHAPVLAMVGEIPQQHEPRKVGVHHLPAPARGEPVVRVEQDEAIGGRPGQDHVPPIAQHAHREAVAVATPQATDVLAGIRQEVPAVAPQPVARRTGQVLEIAGCSPRQVVGGNRDPGDVPGGGLGRLWFDWTAWGYYPSDRSDLLLGFPDALR